MDVIQKVFYLKKIRNFLIFFVCIVLQGCFEHHDIREIKIEYKNQKAIYITFKATENSKNFKVSLKNQDTEIIGEFSSETENIKFTPVIPFTNGMQYQLKSDNKIKAFFTIKDLVKSKDSELLAIYPSTDTVPENMLKIYLQFSQPMQEVRNSLDYITVFNLSEQKEVDIFLELQPELWNKEHTRLTLWLDPGRIKTGLIPNKKMGLPLNIGNQYKIKINKSWKDANGFELAQDYSKIIYVIPRDEEKPNVKQWKIRIPQNSTIQPLVIDFKEPLDAILTLETIGIYDANKDMIKGKFILKNNEKILEFTPVYVWKKGNYTIHIESRLEDLAGNNLNHPFDVDLMADTGKNEISATKNLSFLIL